MQHLIELRKERGLTKVDMGRIIDKTSNAYAMYETNQREMPVKTLIVLANFFGVTTDYLLDITDEIIVPTVIEKTTPLPRREKELLDLFRRMDYGKQERLIGIAFGFVGAASQDSNQEEAI